MIREITIKDINQYISIRRDALKINPEAFSANEDETENKDFISKRLRQKNDENFTLIYFEENKPIGTISFMRETNDKLKHKANIYGFFVYPEFRNKGIGQSLFDQLISKSQKLNGIEKILLSVTSNKAQNFYERNGFKKFGYEKNALKVKGKFVEEVFMERYMDK